MNSVGQKKSDVKFCKTVRTWAKSGVAKRSRTSVKILSDWFPVSVSDNFQFNDCFVRFCSKCCIFVSDTRRHCTGVFYSHHWTSHQGCVSRDRLVRPWILTSLLWVPLAAHGCSTLCCLATSGTETTGSFYCAVGSLKADTPGRRT